MYIIHVYKIEIYKIMMIIWLSSYQPFHFMKILHVSLGFFPFCLVTVLVLQFTYRSRIYE